MPTNPPRSEKSDSESYRNGNGRQREARMPPKPKPSEAVLQLLSPDEARAYRQFCSEVATVSKWELAGNRTWKTHPMIFGERCRVYTTCAAYLGWQDLFIDLIAFDFVNLRNRNGTVFYVLFECTRRTPVSQLQDVLDYCLVVLVSLGYEKLRTIPRCGNVLICL